MHRMVKRAIEMEGTATGEHGVGLVKRDYLPDELGPETVDAMRQVRSLPYDNLRHEIGYTTVANCVWWC